jgi:nitrogen regulatory protein P-II 1
MDLMLVVAIIQSSSLEAVEKGLQQMGVRDITVTKVRGYGEYVDFLSRDHLGEQVKIEVFAPRDRAQHIASAIVDAAHVESSGDGIVATLRVESILDVRTRSEAVPNAPRG